MKKIITFSLFLVLFGINNAWAANFAVITNPPTMINLVILGVAFACLFGTFKILDLLRGGQLFKSWQIFMIAFISLALAQISVLLSAFEIVALPAYVGPALLAASFGLFMFGIQETKKTLG